MGRTKHDPEPLRATDREPDLRGFWLPGQGSGQVGRFRGVKQPLGQAKNHLRETWRPGIEAR
jgi:hypothetical protein